MDQRHYEQQRIQLADMRDELSDVSAKASSADGLVEVTVDQFGIVTDVRLQPHALRAAAANLGRAVTEAARAAARLAQEQVVAISGPIEEIVGRMPDPEELLPGAPSLREPDEVAATAAPAGYEDDEYDDWYEED